MSSPVEGGGWGDESSGLLFVERQSQTGINFFIMLILCSPQSSSLLKEKVLLGWSPPVSFKLNTESVTLS